jgi:hypothetical protein
MDIIFYIPFLMAAAIIFLGGIAVGMILYSWFKHDPNKDKYEQYERNWNP